MATITITTLITGTLTPIVGVSVAAWAADNSSVITSGITGVGGTLNLTLANGTYNLKLFKAGYTLQDQTLVVSGDASVSYYGDQVEASLRTYVYYKNQIFRNLGNRIGDPQTPLLVMTNFNFVQEILTRLAQWEDLETTKTPSTVAHQSSYSYSNLGFSTIFHKIYSIKLFADAKWYPAMNYINPIKWDQMISPLVLLSEGKPYIWTRYAKQIVFYKTPDAVYPLEIRATAYPSPITQDSDPVIFYSIDSLLINLTTAYTHLSLQEKDLAMNYFKIATLLMKAYSTDLNSLLNFVASSEIPTSTIQDYWIDPFVKKMP